MGDAIHFEVECSENDNKMMKADKIHKIIKKKKKPEGEAWFRAVIIAKPRLYPSIFFRQR